ncbi:MAG: hypothetical protein RRA51_02660 [Armatimonadota bacterium]|nr:hypothetical protein [Armatimonadota bacterium]
MARLPAEPKTYRQIREVGKSAVQERQRMASWDKGHRARNMDTENRERKFVAETKLWFLAPNFLPR